VLNDSTDFAKGVQELSVEWFAGKQFTKDWTSKKIARWVSLLKHLQGREIDILEVGSFEGRSAVFLLNFFPLAKITCIDFFKGELDERFDFNLRGYEGRLEKRRGSAIRHLDALQESERKFHLIYLDAAKYRDPALIMSLMAWSLLHQNGILFWDDYEWGKGRKPEDRPHDGIDIFLDMYAGKFDLLLKDRQVFIKKTNSAVAVA